MGFEPTTLGTTNRCSNQLSYSHHGSFRGHFWSGRERKDITLLPMSSPSHCDFFATLDAWRTNSKSCTRRAGFLRRYTSLGNFILRHIDAISSVHDGEFGHRCRSRAPWAAFKMRTADGEGHLASGGETIVPRRHATPIVGVARSVAAEARRMDWKPDLVHVHVAHPAGAAAVAWAKRWGVPVVLQNIGQATTTPRPPRGGAVARSRMR